ncbi:hypothetical protein BSL78_00577 [Apostichopus japonicus]|uniref:Integrase catalytic domain-containing protein n=1 Tax=Stichopus japonicus TaxID=307972 RepID=A0A2G8LQM9_STIJA|nr:hypothetical protein BSL78_00577 [Apostichopus japonicus]
MEETSWLRMPFGISTAPEEYQRRQDQAIEGLPGVRSIVDDILVFGEGDTVNEAIKDHDIKLEKLMERCRETNLKLNPKKLKLKLNRVPFIGHLITDEGLKPDSNKVRSVMEMPDPTDVKGVQRFIGFVNYLSKFLPGLSDIGEPLRKLTLKDTEWCWMDVHKAAVQKVKQLISAKPVLRYYDQTKELTLQTDSSDTGLGSVITQEGQPVAYTSRALTDPETRYAQIEKELLAVIFGLERFHEYTYGRKVTVQSDHKPLEMIAKKPLHRAPKRLQRMLLRLQKYDVIRHEMMKRVHSSHLGVEGCLRRARESIYWPGMTSALKDYISNCDVCTTYGTKQAKETLLPHDVPNRPWAKVGTDLFYFDQKNYLITVDYMSNFWEIDFLRDTTSTTVIRKLKGNFARHGIPDIVVSDNGPSSHPRNSRSSATPGNLNTKPHRQDSHRVTERLNKQ